MTEAAEADSPAKEKSWFGIWVPRAIVMVFVVLAFGFGTVWIFESVSDFLVTLLISFFLAFAMLPAVERLSRRGWRRGAATGVVLLVVLIIAVVFASAIAGLVVDQLIQLVDRLPSYVSSVTIWLNDNLSLEIDTEQLVEEFGDIRGFISERGSDILGGVLGFTSSIVGLVFRGLTIGLFVFYIVADYPKLRDAILRRFPPERQRAIDFIVSTSIDKTGGYIYSRSILALLSAGFHFVVFIIIGLPYPLALALWVGVVSQFIPTVGTYIAGAVPVIVALLEDPVDAIWVLGAILIYQQIENYIFSPKITANTMELHPAVAFGSAIVGASLLGAAGALLALPVAATITALASTYSEQYELIESEDFESAQAYADRMQAKADEKGERSAARRLWLLQRFRRGGDTTASADLSEGSD